VTIRLDTWSHGLLPVGGLSHASLGPAGVARKLEPDVLLLSGMPIACWALKARLMNFLAHFPTSHTEFFAPKAIPGVLWSHTKNLGAIVHLIPEL